MRERLAAGVDRGEAVIPSARDGRSRARVLCGDRAVGLQQQRDIGNSGGRLQEARRAAHGSGRPRRAVTVQHVPSSDGGCSSQDHAEIVFAPLERPDGGGPCGATRRLCPICTL